MNHNNTPNNYWQPMTGAQQPVVNRSNNMTNNNHIRNRNKSYNYKKYRYNQINEMNNKISSLIDIVKDNSRISKLESELIQLKTIINEQQKTADKKPNVSGNPLATASGVPGNPLATSSGVPGNPLATSSGVPQIPSIQSMFDPTIRPPSSIKPTYRDDGDYHTFIIPLDNQKGQSLFGGNNRSPLSILMNAMNQEDQRMKDIMKVDSDEIEEETFIDASINVEKIVINNINDLIGLGDLYNKLKEEHNKKNNQPSIQMPIHPKILKREPIKDAKIFIDKYLGVEQKEENNTKNNNGLYELYGKYYSVNLETVAKLKKPLMKLANMIGLAKLKDQIFEMVLYHLQKFDKKHKSLLHTVIEGPPGVGKTHIGKIIGQIYAALGVLASDKFKSVRRSDLIGKYVGHTAPKLQKIIDEAEGGVLFIDEAYALGSPEGKDAFSKECLDTLNQNLSENSSKFICIIAGYQNELETSFFAANPGLRSRFPYKFTIEGYNDKEVKDIFIKKLTEMRWKLANDIDEVFMTEFFKTNIGVFVYFGRDIDNLITSCKTSHSRRVLNEHPSQRKNMSKEDITNGLKRFIDNKQTKDKYNGNISMYI